MISLKLITDYNNDIIEKLLINSFETIKINVIKSDYNQFFNSLIDNKNIKNPEKTIRYINLELSSISASFKRINLPNDISYSKIKNEVDEFIEQIIHSNKNYKYTIVSIFTSSRYNRGFGINNFNYNFGIGTIILKASLHLIQKLKKQHNTYIVDSSLWHNTFEKEAEKNWYYTKSPFSLISSINIAEELKSIIINLINGNKKIIICDLDNTLWGGIIGDDGINNILLGGHDPIGESFKDFQLSIKRIKEKGILLAIVSKNEEKVALNAINKHPEMILKKEDFVTWRINWKDKAENISEIMSELNLGLDSAIFLDDDASERDRVKNALHGIYVPKLPIDKTLYPLFFEKMNFLDILNYTTEDVNKTTMYQIDRDRRIDKNKFIKNNSYDNWLKSIKIKVKIEKIKDINLSRILQLINKTNQFNLSTRRLSYNELKKWTKNKNTELFSFDVSDKFGNYGIVGVCGIKNNKRNCEIIDFILSCRVFSKKIEEVMLAQVCKYARKIKSEKIIAKYNKTNKNLPTLDFFKNSKFKNNKKNEFYWLSKDIYKFPTIVKIYESK